MDLKKIDNKKSSTKKLSRITIQQPQTIHLIDTFTQSLHSHEDLIR